MRRTWSGRSSTRTTITFFVEPRVERHTVRTWNNWGLDHFLKKPFLKRPPRPFPVSPWFPRTLEVIPIGAIPTRS